MYAFEVIPNRLKALTPLDIFGHQGRFLDFPMNG
jgi:hypothetical protein